MDDEDMEMDMTPMIDVSFQLLIFFLLTINFKLEEGNLSAHLPKKGGAGAGPVSELSTLKIDITYREPGITTLSIDGETFGSWEDGENMSDEREAIGGKAWNKYSSIAEDSEEDTPVKIKADTTVPAGRVITTVDIVKQYIVEPEQERGNNVPLEFTGASRKALLRAAQQ